MKIGVAGNATMVGMAGKSGSGKSTLCDVLSGIRPLQAGTLVLETTNGQYSDVAIKHLGEVFKIGYVSETSTLMSTSLRNNLLSVPKWMAADIHTKTRHNSGKWTIVLQLIDMFQMSDDECLRGHCLAQVKLYHETNKSANTIESIKIDDDELDL